LFYKKVEAYCKKNNIAISAFEKKCGLGNGTIGGWVESNPRIDSLEKVAAEMGITLVELLTDTKDTQ
jgi:transcriptional regulator with XRE-family HTH domain